MIPESSERDVIWAFSTRSLKNMSLVYGDTQDSIINRKDFLGPLGIDYRDLVCAKQTHSDHVRCVREQDRGKGALSYDASIPETDALITDIKDLPLAVFTADCLSLFLYDPLKPAIGLVHAGWRGSRWNIAAGALRQMQALFGTELISLKVRFGPCIGSCCYEVGPGFRENFPEGVKERENRYYLDLVEVNKRQLLSLGVSPSNMFFSDICTSCRNEEFFSFRKEGKTCARMMSVMMLK